MKNFKLYNASAGSGKTFTLVKEFLKLLFIEESRFYFTHILAITFTNKAAAEMKGRILSALQELAGLSEKTAVTSVILPEIMVQSSKTKEEIQKSAKLIFFTILHQYDDFPISTIDSFVQKIIRQFARDLQLSMNFEVELDTKEIIESVIDLLVSEVGVNEEITKVVIDFLHFKDSLGKTTNVAFDLEKFAQFLLKEETIQNVEELSKFSNKELKQAFQRIRKYQKEYESKISSIAQNAIDLMQVSGIDPIEDFAYKKSGVGAYFLRIANKDYSKMTPNKYVFKAINEDAWYSKTFKKEEVKRAINEIKGDIILFYQEIWEDYKEYRDLGLVSQYAYPMTLLNVIYRLLEDYKLEENLLAITDFNPLISKVIKNSEVPFIYEKLAAYYKHFLIDEFQDTSVLQWQNLLPLVFNSLSEGNLNMLVGDGKQAIYRWRSGEVQQFVKLPEIFQKTSEVQELFEHTLRQSYEKQQLMVNRRSKKTIVDFNIELFDFLKKYLSDGFEEIYQGLKEESASNEEVGYVEINFLDGPEEEDYLEEVFRIIQENLEKDYKLGDMAVLCRKNADAAAIGKYLMEEGIAVLSNESLLLNSSYEVRFMVALSQFLLHPDSHIYSAEMLYYAKQLGFIQEDENRLFRDANRKGKNYLAQWFGGNEGVSYALQLPLYEFYELIFRKLFSENEQHLYLTFFMENVLSQSGKKKADLPNFLAWWEKKKNSLSIVIPEGIDAVTIITIHKAKGLQFPIVIYPFANDKVKIDGDVWINNFDNEITKPIKNFLVPISKNKMEGTSYEHLYTEEKNQSYLDLLNVFYVALTRPQDKLYVVSEPQKGKEVNSISAFLLEYLKTKEKYRLGDNQYALGENISCPKVKEEKILEMSYGKQFISNDWKPRLRLRLESEDDINEERAFGNLVHKLLAEINSVEDIQKTVNRFSNQGYIKQEEVKNWEKRLFDYVVHPKLAPFFSQDNQIYAEKTILYQGKTYRPDRVLINDNSLTVIDFKTGKFLENHKEQVNQYANLLHTMGYDTVLKLLVYFGNEVEVVEFS